jgi:hypothetical protein
LLSIEFTLGEDGWFGAGAKGETRRNEMSVDFAGLSRSNVE